MPNILQPDSNSQANLSAFLETVKEDGLRELLMEHLQDILAVGRVGSGKETQPARDSFFEALEALIEEYIEGRT